MTATCTISQSAIDLIVAEEVTDEKSYARLYPHFDWPGDDSGPTVGIGYDCGYCKVDEITQDWDGIISADQIAVLIQASGLKRDDARKWVKAHRKDVTIPWSAAIEQFKTRELPKWIGRVTAVLPNCELLSSESLGALVSLAYNRGASFHKDGDRYKEMRDIARLMQTKQFDVIPASILAMRRLWPKDSDLWRRRQHESEMFAKGLPDMHPAAVSHESALIYVPPPPRAINPVHVEPVALPEPPSIIVTAAKSRTLPMLASGIGVTVYQTGQAVSDWIGRLFGVLPAIQTDAQSMLDPIQSLMTMAQIKTGTEICGVITIVLIAWAAWRHLGDRHLIEVAGLKS